MKIILKYIFSYKRKILVATIVTTLNVILLKSNVNTISILGIELCNFHLEKKLSIY